MLRNSAIPVVTVMGLQFGALVGGSVVVETVFAWPGVGWLMIQSIEARDLPVIRAAVLVLAVFIVVINLIVDVLYTVLDPAHPPGGALVDGDDAGRCASGAQVAPGRRTRPARSLVLLVVLDGAGVAGLDAASARRAGPRPQPAAAGLAPDAAPAFRSAPTSTAATC